MYLMSAKGKKNLIREDQLIAFESRINYRQIIFKKTTEKHMAQIRSFSIKSIRNLTERSR